MKNKISRNSEAIETLSCSLQKTFKLIKVILFLLAIIFFFSNIYWVEEGTVVIHSRFGKILTKNGAPAVTPGGPYFALPYPIDKITKIPTTMQNISINEAFWINDQASEQQTSDIKTDTRKNQSFLIPGIDGSLITGDKNIVQGQWSVNFQLDYYSETSNIGNSAELFAKNVGSMQNAERIVASAMKRAIIATVAELSVDDFVRGDIDNNKIKENVMRTLKSLNTGIVINQVAPTIYAVPKVLTGDFQAVNLAQSDKASQIERAKRFREKILNQTIGYNAQRVIDAINTYDKNTKKITKNERLIQEKEISNILSSSESGGEVSELLNKAIAYKSKTLERMKGKAKQFEKLSDIYNKNPEILKQHLFKKTLDILARNASFYYLPSDENKTIYIENKAGGE